MLRKLLYIYPQILGYLKLWFYKLVFLNGLKIQGFPRFSSKSIIRIRKGCQLILGHRCHITDHVDFRIAAKGILIIKSETCVGQQSIFTCHDRIEIGNNVMIGPNVTMYDHDHDFKKAGLMNSHGYTTAPIIIEDNVWIGSNVTILKGVRIGEGSVVAAGTLVTKDVPANSLIYNKRQFEIKEIER